jgi:hypothetical protein
VATPDHSKTFYLRTVADAKKIAAAVSKLEPTKEKPYTVKISVDDESRSNKQNRLSFLFYKARGEATGHGEKFERHLCKLTYGIPILLEDAEFNAFYMEAIQPMEYENQLAAMEYVPVTRLMKVREFAHYLDIIDQQSANEGIILPKPSDLYWEALMKAAR